MLSLTAIKAYLLILVFSNLGIILFINSYQQSTFAKLSVEQKQLIKQLKFLNSSILTFNQDPALNSKQTRIRYSYDSLGKIIRTTISSSIGDSIDRLSTVLNGNPHSIDSSNSSLNSSYDSLQFIKAITSGEALDTFNVSIVNPQTGDPIDIDDTAVIVQPIDTVITWGKSLLLTRVATQVFGNGTYTQSIRPVAI